MAAHRCARCLRPLCKGHTCPDRDNSGPVCVCGHYAWLHEGGCNARWCHCDRFDRWTLAELWARERQAEKALDPVPLSATARERLASVSPPRLRFDRADTFVGPRPLVRGLTEGGMLEGVASDERPRVSLPSHVYVEVAAEGAVTCARCGGHATTFEGGPAASCSCGQITVRFVDGQLVAYQNSGAVLDIT